MPRITDYVLPKAIATHEVCSHCAPAILYDDWTHLDMLPIDEADAMYKHCSSWIDRVGWLVLVSDSKIFSSESVGHMWTCDCCGAYQWSERFIFESEVS